MEPMTQIKPRATRGIGVAATATEGDRNSRTTGSAGPPSPVPRLFACDECWSNRCMAVTLAVEMAILLCPKLTVERAAFEQRVMGRNVHHLALLQAHDLVASDQGRQPVG